MLLFGVFHILVGICTVSFLSLFRFGCQTTVLNNFARSAVSVSGAAAAAVASFSAPAWQSRKVNFLIRVASKTKQLVSLSEQSFFVLPSLLFCFTVSASSFASSVLHLGSAHRIFFYFLISLPCFLVKITRGRVNY